MEVSPGIQKNAGGDVLEGRGRDGGSREKSEGLRRGLNSALQAMGMILW